jgi:catechol 2,3-dioxygenase-like lactoylglutathione lyase family enzyme
MLVREFKSVVLTSRHPDATAAFYREVLEIPLEQENHRGTQRHWACQLGSMHFAIHEDATFWLHAQPGHVESTIVSFTVEELEPVLARLEQRGVAVIARNQIGPMSFVALRDLDGRQVCLGTPWPSRHGRAST